MPSTVTSASPPAGPPTRTIPPAGCTSSAVGRRSCARPCSRPACESRGRRSRRRRPALRWLVAACRRGPSPSDPARPRPVGPARGGGVRRRARDLPRSLRRRPRLHAGDAALARVREGAARLAEVAAVRREASGHAAPARIGLLEQRSCSQPWGPLGTRVTGRHRAASPRAAVPDRARPPTSRPSGWSSTAAPAMAQLEPLGALENLAANRLHQVGVRFSRADRAVGAQADVGTEPRQVLLEQIAEAGVAVCRSASHRWPL